MDTRPTHTEMDDESEDVWRIAREAAALMLFKGELPARAIAAAVARHVADARAGRECRGTMVDVESTWIPPGKEPVVSAAAVRLLGKVAERLRESALDDD